MTLAEHGTRTRYGACRELAGNCGTRSGYVHGKCRGEACMIANRRYQRARIAKPTRAPLLGVDAAAYTRLLAAQDGHCALCPAVPRTRRFAVDHDHATGEVRGLLCHRCNRALPSWVTPVWLTGAAVYIARAGAKP